MTSLFSSGSALRWVQAAVAAGVLSACGGGNDSLAPDAGTVAGVETASTAQPLSAVRTTARITATAVAGVYIDATLGSDSNPGTSSQPWKTLDKLNRASLPAGQTVYLRCGQTWRETLSIAWKVLGSGSTVTSYGTGCSTSKPVISGADNFSGGWTKSGTIWSRPVPSGTPSITRLFIDGVALRVAEWPRYGGVGSEYAFTGPGTSGQTSKFYVGAQDLASIGSKPLIGAAVQLRVEPWLIESFTVTAFDGKSGAVTLDRAARYNLEEGSGYVLQGKTWMLGRPGEFVHDTQANRIYVVPATATQQSNLNGSLVEGTVRDLGINVTGVEQLRISGVKVAMARMDGISVSQTKGTVLDGVESRQNGRNGLLAVAGTLAPSDVSVTVKNSVFADNWLSGIDVSRSPQALVQSNQVYDTGTIANSGMSEAGIFAGDATTVDRNKVTRATFRGIRFSGKGGSKVTNNTVSQFCTRLTDCGGIYWRLGVKGNSRLTEYSARVENNTVSDAAANAEGAVGAGTDLVAGIYLDDYSQGVVVQGNLVRNVPFGAYVHNASFNTFQNNKVWLTTSAGLRAQMDQTDGDFMVNNLFTGNQFVPTGSAAGTYPSLPVVSVSNAIWYRTKAYATPLPSASNVFSSNQIVSLFGTSAAVAAVTGSSETQELLSGSAWMSKMGNQERVTNSITYALYQLVTGPEMLTGGGFEGGLTGWATYFSTTPTGSAEAVSTGTGCDGLCAQFVAKSSSDQLYTTTPFTMVPDNLYVVRFRAGLGGTGAITFPYINRSNSPWTSVLPADAWTNVKPISGNAGDVFSFEGVFRPTSSDPARVSLRMATPNVPVNFDSVSVKSVTDFQMGTPAMWSAAIGSPTSVATSVSCDSLGWSSTCSATDADGNATPLPFTLPANTSMMLFRADSEWRR